MAMTKNYATGMNGMGGGEMRSWGGSPEVEAAAGQAPETAVPVVLSTEKITVGVPFDDGSEKKKNKKRKGDKGGTGSRANSNAAKKAEEAAAAALAPVPAAEAKPVTSAPVVESGDAVKATAQAPAVIIPATPLASESQHTRSTSDGSKKKRKAEAETDAADASSSKTAKKLRKALNSIAASKKSAAGSVPLASLIEQISEQVSKKKKSDGVIDATAITQDIKVKFVQADAAGEGQWVLEV